MRVVFEKNGAAKKNYKMMQQSVPVHPLVPNPIKSVNQNYKLTIHNDTINNFYPFFKLLNDEIFKKSLIWKGFR